MSESKRDYEIIAIRDRPMLLDRFVDYYQQTWGIGHDLLHDCVRHSLSTQSPLPRFYCLFQGQRIAGMCGLIINDFISRQDLYPWLCALFVQPEDRRQGLGGKLLRHARVEAHKLGFEKVYLSTDHETYYEQYGWRFLATGYHPEGSGRIYVHDAIASPGKAE